MIKLKKCYLTLLETLIALSLLTLLLTIIFGFFRQMSTLSMLTEVKQSEAFKLRYLESRLAFFFERVVNENKTSSDFYFYIDPTTNGQSLFPSLVFTFDNGVRANPNFSGEVLSRLYLDSDHQLCMATWPIHLQEPALFMQKEILMTGVQKLAFALYQPPEKANQQRDVAEVNVDPNRPLANHWYQNEWPMAFAQMPAIIKIYLTVQENKENKEYEFGFVLPASESYIYYPPN